LVTFVAEAALGGPGGHKFPSTAQASPLTTGGTGSSRQGAAAIAEASAGDVASLLATLDIALEAKLCELVLGTRLDDATIGTSLTFAARSVEVSAGADGASKTAISGVAAAIAASASASLGLPLVAISSAAISSAISSRAHF
jgi:hypothetical protein